MKFQHHKYTYTHPFSSARHCWELVGPDGAIHFHVSIMDDREKYPDPSCGLEFHHLSGDGAPNHVNCPLMGGRCWHEGTSLYASEHLWPKVWPCLRTGDHEAIFKLLEYEYSLHFERDQEAAE